MRLSGQAVGGASFHAPALAASGRSVYVSWAETTPGGISCNRSLDAGATWLPAAIPLAALDTEHQIAAHGSSVCVAWTDAVRTYWNRSLDFGTTWLPVGVQVNLGSPSGTVVVFNPHIASTGGSVYVTWDELFPPTPAVYHEVFFNLAAGSQAYGAGTAGTGGAVPQLSSPGDLAIGGTAVFDFRNGIGGGLGLLAAGFGLTSQVAQPFFGGTLLVSANVAQLFLLGGTAGTAGAGAQSLVIPVPNNPSLLGLNTNFQGMFLDSGAGGGVSMSNGLETWIG